jgi:hypothetical protein
MTPNLSPDISSYAEECGRGRRPYTRPFCPWVVGAGDTIGEWGMKGTTLPCRG